jgi:predicted transcriptional regulator
MKMIHVSSIVADRGFRISLNDHSNWYSRLFDIFAGLSFFHPFINGGQDLILQHEELISFHEKLEEFVLRLLPTASNSAHGTELDFLGNKIKLSRENEKDRDLGFWIRFHKVVGITIDNSASMYFFDITEIYDGEALRILAIIKRSNLNFTNNELRDTFNKNGEIGAQRTGTTYDAFTVDEFNLILDNLVDRQFVVVSQNNKIALSEKGKAVILI